MNKDQTYIAILLDRSGSMAGSERDVVGGVNTFLDEQRKVTGSALVTIAKFDDAYETVYEDVDIKTARLLTSSDFIPRGNTALADAMNRLITHVGAKLEAMPEEKRPGQVIFLIFSDGGENASRETDSAWVAGKVKEQETKYSWKFLFFGMDINAFAVGGTVGVRGYTTSKGGGIARAAHVASAYVGNSRIGNQDIADQMYDSVHVNDPAMSRGIDVFQKSIEPLEHEDEKDPA